MRYLIRVILIFVLLAPFKLQAQLSDFTGYKVFINPGHGGHDSDDRHMITTDFWESDGNLTKGLFLRELFQNMHATVFMSRTTNTTADDLPLSTISAMANAANVDFFLSIHSNGYDGTQNQPLMLFRGYDNQPVYPESKVMAGIMWQKLFEKGNCWTNSNVYVKGDWTFYPDWGTQGLGVLRGLTMPGVLSEGSFHDYIPESWRLLNKDFLHHESWAFLRSFIEYKNVKPLTHGIIAGTVRDPLRSPSWYFKPGTKDAALPLNNARVELEPGNRVYKVDTLNNGFFMFDSVPPGNYKIMVSGVRDFMNDTVDVSVTSNKSTLTDVFLYYDTAKVPRLISFTPSVADSLFVNQEFIFSFDNPMNPDSVVKALTFSPSLPLTFSWENKNTVLKVKPALQYAPATKYTINIYKSACSKWGVRISAPYQFNFVTVNRKHLMLTRSFPAKGRKKISLYPRISLCFDVPVGTSELASKIKLVDESGRELGKIREENTQKDGRGHYDFELNETLRLSKTYRILINHDLSDPAGVKFGHDEEISFLTRDSAYISGCSVEPYDVMAYFWDPEASGSTVGTDNTLTTFTSSSDIKMGGSAAGRLNYVFTGNDGGVCRVFDSHKPSIGNYGQNRFGVWVYGDLSYNILEYWFYVNGSENVIMAVDTINWAGWDFKSIRAGAVGGSGARNFHSVVVRQTPAGDKSGTILFDEAQLLLFTGIEENKLNGDDVEITSFPNPFSLTSTFRIGLKEVRSIELDICNMTGQKVENIFNGELGPGEFLYRWTPSSSVPDGIYFYKLTIKKAGDLAPALYFQKCILLR